MKVISVKEINDSIINNPNLFVDLAENEYHKQLKKAADKVVETHKECPILLISGPSGSGKTTSALRIQRMLGEAGVKSHTLSIDNYFLPNSTSNLPRDENGNIDLESPYRLDIELLGKHMEMINQGIAIEIPVFDFATQSRIKTIPMKREKDEVIIIEGIHALNPLVTGSANDFALCVYVSVRTRIEGDNGKLLHPRLIRLMRRLNRDSLFRGRKFEEIFSLFESVSKGEDLYIMPFKDRATCDIDTFMAYEASIYKTEIYNALKLREDLQENSDYRKIMNIFDDLTPLDVDYSPKTSLVREFVGNSEFEY